MSISKDIINYYYIMQMQNLLFYILLISRAKF